MARPSASWTRASSWCASATLVIAIAPPASSRRRRKYLRTATRPRYSPAIGLVPGTCHTTSSASRSSTGATSPPAYMARWRARKSSTTALAKALACLLQQPPDDRYVHGLSRSPHRTGDRVVVLHEGGKQERTLPALEVQLGRHPYAGAGSQEHEFRGAAPHLPPEHEAVGPARAELEAQRRPARPQLSLHARRSPFDDRPRPLLGGAALGGTEVDDEGVGVVDVGERAARPRRGRNRDLTHRRLCRRRAHNIRTWLYVSGDQPRPGGAPARAAPCSSRRHAACPGTGTATSCSRMWRAKRGTRAARSTTSSRTRRTWPWRSCAGQTRPGGARSESRRAGRPIRSPRCSRWRVATRSSAGATSRASRWPSGSSSAVATTRSGASSTASRRGSSSASCA